MGHGLTRASAFARRHRRCKVVDAFAQGGIDGRQLPVDAAHLAVQALDDGENLLRSAHRDGGVARCLRTRQAHVSANEQANRQKQAARGRAHGAATAHINCLARAAVQARVKELHAARTRGLPGYSSTVPLSSRVTKAA